MLAFGIHLVLLDKLKNYFKKENRDCEKVLKQSEDSAGNF